MSKRISDEARVIGFFRNAPVEIAQSIFGIVKEEMKGRTGGGSPTRANGQAKPRRKRRAVAQAAAPQVGGSERVVITFACDGEPGCEGTPVKRACGHYACDACTDDGTNECLWCVPIGEEEYAAHMRRELGVAAD